MGENRKVVLQNFTAVFLSRGEEENREFLLMKRADDRELNPGVWSGIGGKMEPQEINDPMAACLRETQEETGITEENIMGLTLRYIILRHRGRTISQSYIYFGTTTSDPGADFWETYEGSLHWVRQQDMLDKPYSLTFRAMLEHYLTQPEEGKVIVGVAEKTADSLRVHWSGADQFEK